MLNSCGYKAIYSNNNFNFNIIKIEKIKNDKLNLEIEKKVNNFSNVQSTNPISLTINAEKQIIITSKDKRGNPARYQMSVKVDLGILDDQNKSIEKIFVQQFDYTANSNKFQLNQYEKQIEKSLISEIINEVIKNLSKL